MPTPTKGARLGGSPAHQRHILANLATALFEHGKITTTEAKAKRLRPYAEKLITFAKRGDIHARRQVLTVVTDKSVVHHLFAEIGPRYATRPGGYTRITKIGPRKGDNAPMAVIELVEGQTFAEQAVGEAERARGSRFGRRSAVTGSTAEAAADLAAESPTAAAVAERADAESADADSAGAESADAESAEPDSAAETAVAATEPAETAEVTGAPADSALPTEDAAPVESPAASPAESPAPEPAGAEVPDVPAPDDETPAS